MSRPDGLRATDSLAHERCSLAMIVEMYDSEGVDAKYPEVRTAHERNGETLERIYTGRRFRDDTERMERLFEMYEGVVGAGARA